MDQVSVHDYYAAHAPTHPQRWFKPAMTEPRPAEMSYRGGARTQAEIKEHDAAVLAWDEEYQKQSQVQWPHAWAREMLKARAG